MQRLHLKINGKNNFPFLVLLIFVAAYSGCADKGPQPVPGDQVSFKKHILLSEFIAEGVAVGDVNNDGLIDVMAGPYWFEAPDWKKHELTPVKTFYYDKGYSDAFISHGMDVNHDGWVDFVRIGFPGKEVQWFENPKNKTGHWKVHLITETLGNESAGFYDIDGDGQVDLVGSIPETGEMVWFKSPTDSKDPSWKKFTISEPNSPGTAQYAHGLGVGDMNLNGRPDIIIKEGWWEAPENPTSGPWPFHSAALGEASAQMYAFDVNGNGLQDVISTSAHQLGMWWHEQITGDQGNVQWVTHDIDDSFTQTHGLELVDINNDGHLDLVTGKRYFAHMGADPGEFDTPYVYWYEFQPGETPRWIGHEVDNDSGVGVHVVTQDITGDSLIDIIVANKKGVFVFEQQRQPTK
ncbi:FG-GAP repeat domain-containing protein [Lunatimonas salinarum]|uniref:FG-GAP repeat domain-containing protein n=1 Tax=Lunatimonas salinarum TaxID=1774590 RepID=UPI001AE0583E|nr:VCBS repeat-containing protein [Lunatimonas salinarum]